MTLWAVVPVKNGFDIKSRLAPVLDRAHRRRLSTLMVARVLTALDQSRAVDGVVVVTGQGTQLPPLSTPVRRVPDPGAGLNQAIANGIAAAVAQGADTVLIVPADLPLLQADEVDALVSRADFARGVVIAPSRRYDGTNALLIRPPLALPHAFGADSFARHRDLASRLRLELRLFSSTGTSFDLDVPEDLADLERLDPSWPVRELALTARLD